MRSWGEVDQREGFSSAASLWPRGFQASWPDAQTAGSLYISRVEAAGGAANFTVSLRPAGGGQQARIWLHLADMVGFKTVCSYGWPVSSMRHCRMHRRTCMHVVHCAHSHTCPVGPQIPTFLQLTTLSSN